MGCFHSEYSLETISNPEILSLFLLTPTYVLLFPKKYISILLTRVFIKNQVKGKLLPDGLKQYLGNITRDYRNIIPSISACRPAGYLCTHRK